MNEREPCSSVFCRYLYHTFLSAHSWTDQSHFSFPSRYGFLFHSFYGWISVVVQLSIYRTQKLLIYTINVFACVCVWYVSTHSVCSVLFSLIHCIFVASSDLCVSVLTFFLSLSFFALLCAGNWMQSKREFDCVLVGSSVHFHVCLVIKRRMQYDADYVFVLAGWLPFLIRNDRHDVLRMDVVRRSSFLTRQKWFFFRS